MERRDAIPAHPGTRECTFTSTNPRSGALRWYVKVSRKGRRIGIRERYGTEAFDAAYDAAVAALGGVMRKRRTEPDPLVQPERRYVLADRSQRGQTRYYVQLRNGLPKIRIKAEFGTRAFDDECDAAIVSQIALYGDATDYVNAQKQRNEPRPELPTEPPKPHTLRWYWTLYKHSDHWLGDLAVGELGLSDSTRLQRTGLIESLLPENGEKPFGVLTRKVIKAEMKKGLGGEVQEVRGPGWRQRTQEKLPWSAKGPRRGRCLRRLHREPDDGDVRLDRPEDARVLHRQGEPGEAGMSGMEKIVAFDQSQLLDDVTALPGANRSGTLAENRVVTLRSNFGRKTP
ncbi:hypothetical protein GWG65_07740 [Bradyrhizobium sp. CSA207]|uniref:hypothetical protein n=1 Tax=Bradyrhizobium sp. CSA207 TaxID=2698826 RepID=UPI0023B182AC|nr:hypothetical protein [Bradyrhizobium sp. CSA207]MDE5441343.1 hypothetical protein [Bradyrhizobium sp. CSA207]